MKHNHGLAISPQTPQYIDYESKLSKSVISVSIYAPLCAAGVLGSLNAIAFIAIGLIALMIWPRTCISGIQKGWPLLCYPALGLMSTIWSQYPEVTLRFSGQLFITVLLALCWARLVGKRDFLFVVFLGAALPIALSLLAGSHRGDGIPIGIFGSKNAYASAVALLAMASFAVFIDRSKGLFYRLLGGATLAVCPFILLAAQSADAIIATIIAFCFGVSGLCLSLLSPKDRRIIVPVFVCILLINAMAIIFYIDDIKQFILGAFNKDASLTGRTYLWERGMAAFHDRPILGQGLQAYWVQGNLEAEGLWRHLRIGSRSGFNFHNAYIQTMVETGLVGLTITCTIYLTMLIKVLLWTIRDPSPLSSFLAMFLVYVAIRSYVEVEINAQFSIGALLQAAAWIYSVKQPLST